MAESFVLGILITLLLTMAFIVFVQGSSAIASNGNDDQEGSQPNEGYDPTGQTGILYRDPDDSGHQRDYGGEEDPDSLLIPEQTNTECTDNATETKCENDGGKTVSDRPQDSGVITHTEFFPYVWDPHFVEAEDYVANYCPESCPQEPGKRCSSLTCFSCDCYPSYQPAIDLRLSQLSADYGPTAGCFYKVLGIARCPLTWSDEEVGEACEAEYGQYTDHEPVTDFSTGTSFRNRACARCHGATHPTTWDLEVLCSHFQDVYFSLSMEEFAREGKKSEACFVTRRVPQNITQDCADSLQDLNWFSDVITTCNVTGKWLTYDMQEEKKCLHFRKLSNRVYDGSTNLIFGNLFCALCNGIQPGWVFCPYFPQNDDNTTDKIADTGLSSKDGYPPLSLLLGFNEYDRDDMKEETITCDVRFALLTPNNECRNLTCTPGKVVVNSTCSTAVSQIRGLVYKLNVTLFPVNETIIPDTDDAKSNLINSTRQAIRHMLTAAATRIHIVGYLSLKRTTDPAGSQVLGLQISGDLTASRDIHRDKAEQTLVDNLFSVLSVEFQSVSLSFRHALVSDEPRVAAMALERSETKELNVAVFDELDRTSVGISPELHIPLSPFLLCPYLEFDSSEYETRESGNNTDAIEVVLKFGEEQATLSDLEKAVIEDGTLRVCQETLESLPRVQKAAEMKLTWQYILSMVVIPLSILCLVLTLIVYLLLPVLRTEPGLNTMGTCVALLVAQVALLLASHRVTSGPGCQALGMLVHLSWLSMFCWTSVCSVHMFHVFSAKTYRGSSSGRYRKLARNALLTLLLPSLVVALVVGLSHVTSGGQSIGYSDFSCYLESALLKGVAMLLPLGLMLVLNLGLFILTARRIYTVTKLQPRAETEGDSRQHLHVCARLSVLTGAFWILSLLAEGLEIEWLQAIAILANGGQGILLFLSYVTTRRVADMLAVKFGLKEKEVSTGKTQSTNDKYSPSRTTKSQISLIENTAIIGDGTEISGKV